MIVIVFVIYEMSAPIQRVLSLFRRKCCDCYVFLRYVEVISRQEQEARQINTKQEAVIALEARDSPTANSLGQVPETSLIPEDSSQHVVPAHSGALSTSISPMKLDGGGGYRDGMTGAGAGGAAAAAIDEKRLGSGQLHRPGNGRDALTTSPAPTNEEEKQQLTMAYLKELETSLGLTKAKVRMVVVSVVVFLSLLLFLLLLFTFHQMEKKELMLTTLPGVCRVAIVRRFAVINTG